MPWSRMNVFVPFPVLTIGFGGLVQMRGPKVSVSRVTSPPFASRTLKVGVHRQIPGTNPLMTFELGAGHDEKGRFCRAPGGGGSSLGYRGSHPAFRALDGIRLHRQIEVAARAPRLPRLRLPAPNVRASESAKLARQAPQPPRALRPRRCAGRHRGARAPPPCCQRRDSSIAQPAHARRRFRQARHTARLPLRQFG